MTRRLSPSTSVRRITSGFFFFSAVLLLVSADDAKTYIVHMEKSAMPAVFSDPHAWYGAALRHATSDDSPAGRAAAAAAATAAGRHAQLIYAYAHAIDGFSARLSESQLERLAAVRGFLAAYPSSRMELATTRTPEFLGLREDSGIWPESHFGGGAIIGVIDSGVWPESASFRDDGMPPVPARWKGACVPGDNFTAAMCNRKLIGARYFDRGVRAENPTFQISFRSARDPVGHGTHAAAAAAGNFVRGASYFGYAAGTARGIAPRAHLAVYKAAWDNAFIGISTADVMAAIDQAIADGVDVISISIDIGVSQPLDQNPVSIAAFSAMEKGIFVAVVAGNAGPSYKSIFQGIPWALTVGESTLDRKLGGRVVLGDGTTIDAGSLYAGKPTSTKQLPLLSNIDCENDTLLAANKNSIPLCSGPEISYLVDLEIAVRDAKLPGAIFSSYAGLEPRFTKFPFPATFANYSQGNSIAAYFNKSTNPTASIHFRRTVTGTRAPAVAQFSSRGPSASCPDVLKPDLVAPGSLVLAAYSPIAPVASDRGEDLFAPFNIISGTSIACPHAAGVAAMLKVLHPDWSPAAIRSAMMTTANPLDNTGRPIIELALERPANPLEMGAGHLDPNKAQDPGLVYDAGADDYRKLLCAMNFTEKQIQTIARSPIKKDCKGASVFDLNYPSFLGYFDPEEMSSSPGGKTIVREFRRTVTNVADGAWTYTARLTEMDGFTVSVKPHRLEFKRKEEKQSFTLRIVGHKKLGSFDVIHGSLSWVDQQGKHVVRSPIVATTHDLPQSDD